MAQRRMIEGAGALPQAGCGADRFLDIGLGAEDGLAQVPAGRQATGNGGGQGAAGAVGMARLLTRHLQGDEFSVAPQDVTNDVTVPCARSGP